MFKKILCLVLIAVLAVSSIGACSAENNSTNVSIHEGEIIVTCDYWLTESMCIDSFGFFPIKFIKNNSSNYYRRLCKSLEELNCLQLVSESYKLREGHNCKFVSLKNFTQEISFDTVEGLAICL